jgi:2-methylcitrate dehydratase PrpD
MSVTSELAAYAVSGGFDDLPDQTVDRTKLAILNILGAAIGGCGTNIGRNHIALAQATGGGISEATIIGGGGKLSIPMAVYANASLAFALDYEDVVHYCIHPGPVTVPAALAIGEHRHLSGKDFIIAIERGYEIGTRIGTSMLPSAERGAQVWGQQYTPFAPCIAASRLLGLDADQTEVAMGITGTYALVPSAYKYFGIVDETRPIREAKLGWGWMALGGVFGALSAAQGFSGGHGILDGDEGFWIMAGSDKYPSIAWNHAPFVAIEGLKAENGFSADDVESVTVKGLGAVRIADYAPAGEVDAMFSLPYTVALTLLGDPLLPEMYSDERRLSEPVQRLLKRVRIEEDQDAELAWFNEQRMCAAVTIQLADGRSLRRAIEFPRDKPDIGWPELEAKFRGLAAGRLPDEKIDVVVEMTRTLEDCEDVAALAALLAP